MVDPVEATALANNVFPVPGGPNIKTPLQALLIPVKNCGIFNGNKTAYWSKPFAVYKSAISSKFIFGDLSKTYLYSI